MQSLDIYQFLLLNIVTLLALTYDNFFQQIYLHFRTRQIILDKSYIINIYILVLLH